MREAVLGPMVTILPAGGDAGAGRAMPAGRGGDLDVSQLWSALRRKQWWILLPTAVALAASTVAVNLMKPRYTGEVRLLLQSGDNYYTRPSGASDRDSLIDEREVMSQVQVITSRDLAREAIRILNLRGNPDFDPTAQPSLLRELGESVGLVRPVSEDRANEKLFDEYRDRVTAFPVMQSRVLQIEFSSGNPELAARGANTVAQLFLEAQAQSKLDTARTAGGWLNSTIEPLRKRVEEAEAKAEEFRARSGLIISTNNNTLTQQQLADINAQLSAARTTQADSQARARLIREALKAGRPMELSDIANNELVRKLTNDRAALRAQLALESRTLLPAHPRIKELTAQINDVESQLRFSAEKAARTFENDALVSQARVDSLTAALESLKQQTVASNESEVMLRSLERDARTLREQLDAMTLRYREAVARDAREAAPADARIISRADTPGTPTFPKKGPIIGISTAATFLIAVALVLSRELVSGRAFVPQASFPAPVEATLPLREVDLTADEGVGDGVEDNPVTPLARAARAMAAALDEAGPPLAEEASVLDIPAMAARVLRMKTAAGEGLVTLVSGVDRKATRDAALRLGRSLATRAQVVLIDGTASPAPVGQLGLRDLGRDGVSFADVINRDPRSRLHLVGPGAGGTEDTLAEAFAQVLGALRQTYEIVLVCCDPPTEPGHFSWWLAETVGPLVLVASAQDIDDAVREVFEAARPGRPAPLPMAAELAVPLPFAAAG